MTPVVNGFKSKGIRGFSVVSLVLPRGVMFAERLSVPI
jgi:hypothetical protein